MTLAYRVEELLALRDSISESAVSLNKLDGEDALRGKYDFYRLLYSPFCSPFDLLLVWPHSLLITHASTN